jgi:hypothetical protein
MPFPAPVNTQLLVWTNLLIGRSDIASGDQIAVQNLSSADVLVLNWDAADPGVSAPYGFEVPPKSTQYLVAASALWARGSALALVVKAG